MRNCVGYYIICNITITITITNNLVDPASSHTLVSKIKPCMCKSK